VSIETEHDLLVEMRSELANHGRTKMQQIPSQRNNGE
jgi:hypothetical protein